MAQQSNANGQKSFPGSESGVAAIAAARRSGSGPYTRVDWANDQNRARAEEVAAKAGVKVGAVLEWLVENHIEELEQAPGKLQEQALRAEEAALLAKLEAVRARLQGTE